MLCVVFGSMEVTYAGTFSGDVYKWNENRLQTVIGAHSVSYCYLHMVTCNVFIFHRLPYTACIIVVMVTLLGRVMVP